MADIGITVNLDGLNKVVNDLQKLKGETEKAARGMNEAAKSTQNAASSFEIFRNNILKAGAAIGSIAVVVDSFRKIDDALTRTVVSAKAFGMSAETLERWRYAATTARVDAEAFTTSIEGLTAKAGDALLNKLGDSGKAFAYLGVSLTDAQGKFRGTQAVFEQTIEALSRVENEGTRTRIALALLGPEGVKLANTFKDGAEQFREAGKGLTTVGDVLGPRFYKAFENANGVVKQFNDTVTQLSTIAYAAIITGLNDVAVAVYTVGKASATSNIPLQDQVNLLSQVATAAGSSAGGYIKLATGLQSAFQYGKSLGESLMGVEKAASSASSGLGLRGSILPTVPKAVGGEAALGTGNPNAYEQSVNSATKAVAGLTNAQLIQASASKAVGSSLDDVTRKQEEVLQANQNLINEGLNKPFIEAEESARSFAQTLSSGLRDVITGTGDLSDRLDNLGKSLLDNIANQAVFKPLEDSITGLLTGQKGEKSEGGGLIGNLLKSLGGGSGETGNDTATSQGFFEGLTTTFDAIIPKFGQTFELSVPKFGGIFDELLSGMGGIFDGLLGGLGNTIGGLLGGGGGGGGLFGGGGGDVVGGLVKGALSFLPGGGFLSAILPFANGGEMTVSRPTLFTAGERGAERIRVSPLAGGLSRGGSGGVTVNIPQGAIISGISAGSFARQMARQIERQQARAV